jgi:hypothetical protein
LEKLLWKNLWAGAKNFFAALGILARRKSAGQTITPKARITSTTPGPKTA